MTDTDIKTEITRLVDSMDLESRMPATHIVQSIVSAHGDAAGDSADFYTCCAYGHVRALVRSTLQRMKQREGAEEAEQQFLLPGFERLQLRYIIELDGEQVVMPLELMSVEQIRAKQGELNRMARGCVKHSDELDRYLVERQARVAAAAA